MNIPKNIKIFGQNIKIVKDARPNSGNDDFGSYDGETNVLRIRSDVPLSVQESTLLHEILEAINEQMELKLDHRQICALEIGLYSTLKENKLLK